PNSDQTLAGFTLTGPKTALRKTQNQRSSFSTTLPRSLVSPSAFAITLLLSSAEDLIFSLPRRHLVILPPLMEVLGSMSSVGRRVEWASSVVEAMVVETAVAAGKALACLLFMTGLLVAEAEALPSLTDLEERFPFSKLHEKECSNVEENKDASDTDDDGEDDDDDNAEDDDDDDDAGDEDFTGDEGGDPEDDPEVNGAGDSDDDEDDDDDDEDDGDDDGEDDDDDDEEDEEDDDDTPQQPPAKKRK
ncbi:unnamed protein product, partial [Linum tenue]